MLLLDLASTPNRPALYQKADGRLTVLLGLEQREGRKTGPNAVSVLEGANAVL